MRQVPEVVRRRVRRGGRDPGGADRAVELGRPPQAYSRIATSLGWSSKLTFGTGQAVLVERVGVQGDPVGGLRHVLADDPQAGGVLVAVEDLGEGRAPRARVGEGGEERRSQRQRLQVEAADEAAGVVEAGLVGDDPGHRLAAVHAHRLLEPGVRRRRQVAHVVAADLPRAVGQAVRELR
jgi:hypothetical protein